MKALRGLWWASITGGDAPTLGWGKSERNVDNNKTKVVGKKGCDIMVIFTTTVKRWRQEYLEELLFKKAIKQHNVKTFIIFLILKKCKNNTILLFLICGVFDVKYMKYCWRNIYWTFAIANPYWNTVMQRQGTLPRVKWICLTFKPQPFSIIHRNRI